MPFSTFLDGRTHSQLRGIAWLSLSDTGHILRGSATDDQGGGITQVWGTAGTVSCRIDPLSGREQVFGGQIDDRTTHVLTLPAGTDISDTDQVVIASRGTFEVTAVRTRTREWVRYAEVVGT